MRKWTIAVLVVCYICLTILSFALIEVIFDSIVEWYVGDGPVHLIHKHEGKVAELQIWYPGYYGIPRTEKGLFVLTFGLFGLWSSVTTIFGIPLARTLKRRLRSIEGCDP